MAGLVSDAKMALTQTFLEGTQLTYPECYKFSQKYAGGDLPGVTGETVANAEECQSKCQSNEACAHFSVALTAGSLM